MRQRAIHVGCWVLGGLILGFLYGIWCEITNLSIPCLFYKITGKYCPGCGITRMCLNLLKGDLKAAFYSHPAIFLLLPIGGVIAIRWNTRYIQQGTCQLTKWEERSLYVVLIILVVFGFLRNLKGFEMICPR
ncbi:MAG: DUF2752 domain-containing protein [Cellulosilyticum sp.]|nr:DUF2752 domain-containing protein [Cellulosilyticum sp.]